MINFLHTFHPNPILISFGPIEIYWYGFFIVCGILAAIITAVKLGKYYKILKDDILDLSFFLVIFGIIGARAFHVFIEWQYYLSHPLEIFKVWQGGLAIHGGIIAGLMVVYWFIQKSKINFWKLTAIIVPGLAIGQAIGRWGNYFNQELFGAPTNLPWGIPIDMINRPFQYMAKNYFHPAFLYESLGDLLIFAILVFAHWLIIKRGWQKSFNFKLLVAGYLILYSILRFFTEFIRIDQAYYFFGLRHEQVISLVVIILAGLTLAAGRLGAKPKKDGGLEK
ncbi:MAG: prolipoprotein diacylglyceryl transferase [Patescibacteria group bacterium]|jgi:phosphatidylglycerol:prolipoprotein diacylglycerol transferase